MRWRPAAAASVIALALGGAPATPAHAAGADDDPWWGRDKALHFGVSAALAGAGYGGAALFTPRTELRLGAGAAVALSAGVAKELVDLGGRGDASWRDLTWDVVGTATGLVVAWTIDHLVARLSAGR